MYIIWFSEESSTTCTARIVDRNHRPKSSTKHLSMIHHVFVGCLHWLSTVGKVDMFSLINRKMGSANVYQKRWYQQGSVKAVTDGDVLHICIASQLQSYFQSRIILRLNSLYCFSMTVQSIEWGSLWKSWSLLVAVLW